jgi:hypothetical protein
MTDQAFTGWVTVYKAWLATKPPMSEVIEVNNQAIKDINDGND